MKNLRQFKGIIYRVFSSGSLDKVIYIIDEEGQKVSCIAKSVKKQTSKKAHAIELGNYVKGSIIHNSEGLSLLTDLKVLEEFAFWKSEYEKMIFLQLFCEITNKFCYEDNRDEELFKILYNTLSVNASKPYILASAFILKIIDHAGILPNLEKCVVSGEKISSIDAYFDYNQLGYISKTVAENTNQPMQVSDRIYKTQRFIILNNLADSVRLKLAENEEKALFSISKSWLEEAIDSKIKTFELIKF